MEQNYYIILLVDIVLPVIWSSEFLKDRNSRLKPLSFGSFFSQSNKVLFDWNYWYPIISKVGTYSNNCIIYVYIFILLRIQRESFWIEKKISAWIKDWGKYIYNLSEYSL